MDNLSRGPLNLKECQPFLGIMWVIEPSILNFRNDLMHADLIAGMDGHDRAGFFCFSVVLQALFL